MRRFLASLMMLITLPVFLIYSDNNLLNYSFQKSESFEEKNVREPQSLSYDVILRFIDDLESGELEKKCSSIDLHRINQFIALLAKEGAMPGDEIAVDEDIQEFLSTENSYQNVFSIMSNESYVMMPAIYYGHGEIILCTGWIKKQWERTKKFIKKHKKEVIIGTVIVVAAVAVVGIAIAAESAAGVAALAGASAWTDSDEECDLPVTNDDYSSNAITVNEMPILKEAVQQQIVSFKENLNAEDFFESSDSLIREELPLEENARALGSLFAHDSLKNVNNQIVKSSQTPFISQSRDGIEKGHLEIDKKFGTDYSLLYTSSSKEVSFNTAAYQVRGEKALSSGYYEQATNDLGKAIKRDPASPLPYLERGVAHFHLGEYERSLEDYQSYIEQSDKKHSPSVSDFSLGFAKGLPKGVYESGEGMLLFLSDLVRHPVHTGSEMWNALSTLSALARSEQWGVLAEALVPEVHQLATQWDTLSSHEKGNLAGYAFGKHGSDIIIPGALGKAISKGVKGAKELGAVCKSLQTAEKTLLLESLAGLESGAIAEAIQTTQKTIVLGEDLGLSVSELTHLKQTGKLEGVVADVSQSIGKDLEASKSIELYKNAQRALKEHKKKVLSEEQARAYIHKAGLPTLPRPTGIPEDFLVMISDKGGMEYVHPKNTHTRVRVMPGKPHSPNISQQKPYVVQTKHGNTVDKFGNIVNDWSQEAHIPFEEFVYID